MGYVILLWHSLSLPYNYFPCLLLNFKSLSNFLFCTCRVVFCILLLVIYMQAVADQLQRAIFSAIVYLQLRSFCSERFPLPLDAWDGLCYFIVALPEPSI